jgi:pathogenesis-related protein 1
MKLRKIKTLLVLLAVTAAVTSPDTSSGRTVPRSRNPGSTRVTTVSPQTQRSVDPADTGINGESTGSRLTAKEAMAILAAHNRVRAKEGCRPLAWSGKLARYAQQWADHLGSADCSMEHRPMSGRWRQVHGENLFTGTAGYYSITDAVTWWENERDAYSGTPIDLATVSSYGHYTQLVWNSTRTVGCASIKCGNDMLVVCNYDPPGNVLGQRPF